VVPIASSYASEEFAGVDDGDAVTQKDAWTRVVSRLGAERSLVQIQSPRL